MTAMQHRLWSSQVESVFADHALPQAHGEWVESASSEPTACMLIRTGIGENPLALPVAPSPSFIDCVFDLVPEMHSVKGLALTCTVSGN